MNRHQYGSQVSTDRKVNSITLLMILISTFLILLATLYPFRFSFPDSFSLADILVNFNNVSTFEDQVNNVLLFMPLGFYFSSYLQSQKIKIILQILIIILTSASLSFTVELLQVFLPSRVPTPSDVMNNSLGGFFGWLCFYIWNYQSFTNTNITRVRSRHSRKQIIAFSLGYIFLTFVIAFFWQNTTNLSNWNFNYPLIIGNEYTGDRPWQGYVSKIYIADKAISPNEVIQGFVNPDSFSNLGDSLLANYQLQGKCCYQENFSKTPKLMWQGQPSNRQDDKGVFVNSSQWLQTVNPVTYLSKSISKKSEFTLSTTVATANTEQIGPARIISISGSSLRRNLTLSQQGNDLDFRLRTPLTGENGSDLKLLIPNIFVDNKPHQIIITYSRATIQVYIDKLQNYYSFNLLDLIPKNQKIVYYALTFIPFGVSLAILTLASRSLISSRLLVATGILLPSLILEFILVSDSGKSLSLKNLLLGILFTAGTMLILKVRAKLLCS